MLPRELCALIATYIGESFFSRKGDFFRREAGECAIMSSYVKNGIHITRRNGLVHSFRDRPARILPDGTQEWWQNGVLHRDGDLPAVIWADGHQEWYKDGALHRDGDQPAVVWADGHQEWWQNGTLHRSGNAPAVIFSDGDKLWYVTIIGSVENV